MQHACVHPHVRARRHASDRFRRLSGDVLRWQGMPVLPPRSKRARGVTSMQACAVLILHRYLGIDDGTWTSQASSLKVACFSQLRSGSTRAVWRHRRQNAHHREDGDRADWSGESVDSAVGVRTIGVRRARASSRSCSMMERRSSSRPIRSLKSPFSLIRGISHSSRSSSR